MSITLREFIESKVRLLNETFNKVELKEVISVNLSKNRIVESFFLSSKVCLEKIGMEVKVSELIEPNLVNSNNNGNRIEFNVTSEGECKAVTITYYFLWNDIKL